MLSVVFFVAGVLVVAGSVHLQRRLMRRDPDLVGRRADVFELTDKRERVQAAETELAVSEREQRDLALKTQQAEQRAANTVPVSDPPNSKYMWRQAGLVLGGGEAMVLALQGGHDSMAGLDRNAWAFLAPIIVAMLVMLLHVLFGNIVSDHSRPARTARRAKRLFTVSASAVIIGGWFLMSGRGVDDSTLLENLVGIGYLMVLALLALTSTFALIVASALFAAEDDARHLAHLTRLQMLYAQHIDLLKKDLSRLRSNVDGEGNPPSASAVEGSPVSTPPIAPAGVMPTVMILLALLSPALAWSQPSMTSTERPAQAAPVRVHTVRDGVCRFLFDLSISLDAAPWQATTDAIPDHVPLMVETLGCVTVQAAAFVGDPFLNLWEVQVPEVRDTTPDCQSATAPPPTSSAARMTNFLYPKVAEKKRQDAVDQCVADKRAALQQQREERAAVLEKLARKLQSFGKMKLGGPCTEIYRTIERGAHVAETLVILTDGIQTCPGGKRPVPLMAGTRLIFLLLPTGNVSAPNRATLLLNRVRELEILFPGAIVMPASEALIPSFWRRLNVVN